MSAPTPPGGSGISEPDSVPPPGSADPLTELALKIATALEFREYGIRLWDYCNRDNAAARIRPFLREFSEQAEAQLAEVRKTVARLEKELAGRPKW